MISMMRMGLLKNLSSSQRQLRGMRYKFHSDKFISYCKLRRGNGDLIFRWDNNGIEKLPEYMKPCYRAVLDAYKEIEEKENEERSYCVHYAKEAVRVLEFYLCLPITCNI